MSASDTNETFLQTAECFLPASLEIKLCMILQKFIFFFFPLAKWPSGEIVIVSCTFLFWSSCHFLIQLIKGCVFCQGEYIDTSLLLTAEEGHKNFIKGSFCITGFCLAKNICFRISLCIGLIPLISRDTLHGVCPKNVSFLITQICACLLLWINCDWRHVRLWPCGLYFT